MKAYIIKIEYLHSDPLIWRRIIMPADANYKQLHDIIQNSSNFMSGYPYGGYHLYEFDLVHDNSVLTTNSESYEEHQFFIKNRELFDKRLNEADDSNLKFEKNYKDTLAKTVLKPSEHKISRYFEEHKELLYDYDLGDGWEFKIILEEIIYDYKFGYPTLVGGEHNAPPEDVGGMSGYYNMLEILKDTNHPEYDLNRSWLMGTEYQTYNESLINHMLMPIQYATTELDDTELEGAVRFRTNRKNDALLRNEELFKCYPRRVFKNSTYEQWLFPYVNEGTSSLQEDVVLLFFRSNRIEVVLISQFEYRLYDRDHYIRIRSLVDGLDKDVMFDYVQLQNHINHKDSKKVIKEIISKRQSTNF